MRFMLFPTLLALPASAAPAFAQQALEPRAFQMLRQADADRDGIITRDEVSAWRRANFDRLDRNEDGVLSTADIGSGFRARAAGPVLRDMVTRFDTDADGSVSRAEFTDGPAPAFVAADLDRDGRVTASELAQAEARAR